MPERLNIGIIGCGWAGEQHARAYTSLKTASLLMVADIDGLKAEKFGRTWGAKSWYQDYKRVLSDPQIEAVSICLPHYLHCKVAVEAAEANKHVLCEKPIANTLEEADVMIQAAKREGVTLMIAENAKFHPTNLKLKELVDQNYLGDLFLARMFRDHELHAYLRERPWFLNKAQSGGGIWIDGGIHDIAALRMIVGEVETVSLYQAKSVLPEMEGDETVAALLKFRNGAVGVVTESFSTKTFQQRCPTIFNGSIGTAMVLSEEIELYGEKIGPSDTCKRIVIEEADTFEAEIKHFVQCIQNRETPLTSGEEARKSLAVILAGYESLRKEGSAVKVKA